MQKHALCSPIKHLFCLKPGQNPRFNLWKCAVSWCVWKYHEWILNVFAGGGTRLEVSRVEFKCFYALVWRSGGFWAFLFFVLFWQFLPNLGQWAILESQRWPACRVFRHLQGIPLPQPVTTAAGRKGFYCHFTGSIVSGFWVFYELLWRYGRLLDQKRK